MLCMRFILLVYWSKYSFVCICYYLHIHSIVDGQFSHLQFEAVKNNTAMNILYVFWYTCACILVVYIPRNGINGSYTMHFGEVALHCRGQAFLHVLPECAKLQAISFPDTEHFL